MTDKTSKTVLVYASLGTILLGVAGIAYKNRAAYNNFITL